MCIGRDVRAMTLLGLEILICEGGKVSVRVASVAGSAELPAPDLRGRTGGFPLGEAEKRVACATGKEKASALGSRDRLLLVVSFQFADWEAKAISQEALPRKTCKVDLKKMATNKKVQYARR